MMTAPLLIVGAGALNFWGWTTQCMYRPEIVNCFVLSPEHFNFAVRSKDWLELVSSKTRYDTHWRGVKVLRPAWVLADAIACGGGWGFAGFGLDPDDIDWDEVTAEDEQDWINACAAFRLAHIPLEKMREEGRFIPHFRLPW